MDQIVDAWLDVGRRGDKLDATGLFATDGIHVD